MIIHAPEISRTNGEACVSARVEFQTSGVSTPDTLWFAFPESDGTASTGRADGFVAALLLVAMRYGEDIQVRGTVSPRLLRGLYEYQRIFHAWFPERYSMVTITYDNLQPPEPGARGTACAFSGGVDSFYSLQLHLPQHEQIPGYQITSGFFIHGLDIPLDDESTYRTAAQAYDEMFQSLGLTLFTGRTNIRRFVDRAVWEFVHGATLTGLVLMLDRAFARFYIPSSHTYADLYPWGSDYRIDHLLATETLEVVHDGANAMRLEKLAAIARWPETYARLRVCWEKPDGLTNCCRCNKCIRTMTTLDLLGVLPHYTTFPLPLERQHIRDCRFLSIGERRFARQILDYAVAAGRHDIAFDLRYALLRSYARSRYRQMRTLPVQILSKLNGWL